MPTRSFCAAVGNVPAGGTRDVYTVPAGNTFLLKTVDLQVGSGAAAATISIVAVHSAGPACVVASPSLSGGGATVINVWVAFPAAAKVRIVSGSAAVVNYWVSGALLPGAVPATQIGGATKPAEPDEPELEP